MKIEVTEEDIKHGCRCDPDCCPVGRALSRAGVAHLGVLGTVVVIEDGHEHAAFMALPVEVKEWILRFDSFDPVTPIAFDMPLRAAPEEAAWRLAA